MGDGVENRGNEVMTCKVWEWCGKPLHVGEDVENRGMGGKTWKDGNVKHPWNRGDGVEHRGVELINVENRGMAAIKLKIVAWGVRRAKLWDVGRIP